MCLNSIAEWENEKRIPPCSKRQENPLRGDNKGGGYWDITH